MSNREMILNRLRGSSSPQYQSKSLVELTEPLYGDLELFMEKATAAGAEVFQVPDNETARDQLKNLMGLGSYKSIIASNEPVIIDLNLDDLASSMGLEYKAAGQLTPAEYRQYVLQADIGISGCDYALANSGTVVISPKNANERLISLAPSYNICVVKADQLLADRFSMAAVLEKEVLELPSVITMVTGVSRTADVALQTVLGMHGPRKMDIIIIG